MGRPRMPTNMEPLIVASLTLCAAETTSPLSTAPVRTPSKPAYFTITADRNAADEDGVQQGDELTILAEDWYYGG